jgi:type VI secretion system secreted protein Hcp
MRGSLAAVEPELKLKRRREAPARSHSLRNMRKSLLIGLSFAFVSIAAAVHADTVTMTVKSSKQGEIKGGGVGKGREGSIECVDLGFEIDSSRDLSSGQTSGKRQYKPLRCVKRVDRSSPPLFSAMMGNEVLANVALQVWGTSKDGQLAQIYSVVLKSANILSLRQFLDKGAMMEELTFSYSSIALTWADGGITAEDSLRAN